MEPYLAEIRLFAGDFAPKGWALCDGKLLQIEEHQALFSLLGDIYGGDGRTNFALPDLRGRIPVGYGDGRGLSPKYIGQMAGVERVALTINELPAHSHEIASEASASTEGLTVSGSGTIKCSGSSGNSAVPTDSFPAKTKAAGGDKIYTDDPTKATETMNGSVIELNASVHGNVEVAVVSDCHNSGGGTSHENMQPSLGLNYIISTKGLYPPRH